MLYFSPNTTQWIARHNTIRAHTAAWHVYDEEFRSSQKGQVGITLNSDYMEPVTTNDIEATKVFFVFKVHS